MKNKLEMLNLLKIIQRNIPTPQWKYLILAGDLNININNSEDSTTKALITILKQMGHNLCQTGPTRLDCMLDIIALGSGFSNVQSRCYSSLSDHDLRLCTFQISKVKVSDMKLKIPNRKAADKISLDALRTSSGAMSFLKNIVQKMEKRQFNIMKEIKIKPQKNELMERILSIENEDEDVGQLISHYWNEMNSNMKNLIL